MGITLLVVPFGIPVGFLLFLFPVENNLGCYLNLCPRLQSLLCSDKSFLFFIQQPKLFVAVK